MANAGHLVRRTSQREMIVPQKSIDRLEMRDMRNRLVQENGGPTYGTANQGFDDQQVMSIVYCPLSIVVKFWFYLYNCKVYQAFTLTFLKFSIKKGSK